MSIESGLTKTKTAVKSFSAEMLLLQGWPFGDHFDV